MDRMKIEDWNKLTLDQRKLVEQDKLPQTIADQRKASALTPEEILSLQQSVKTIAEQLETLRGEKTGIYADLKEERKLTRELAEKVKTLETGGGGQGADDDFLTLRNAKALIAESTKATEKVVSGVRSDMAREREHSDEHRMKGRTDLPVPYHDAVKVFVTLAKANPLLYKQVQEEAHRAGGRPAEMAYKIALREHPEFVQKVKESGAQEIISNLSKAGKLPKNLPAGGAGAGGAKKVEDMTLEEVMSLSEEDWLKAAKG